MSRRRVVIIGGGFAGIAAARNLDRARFEVTLLDRCNYHLFQPLLYQVATGSLAARAPGLKTLEDAFAIRNRVLGALEEAEACADEERRRQLLRFVVVGADIANVCNEAALLASRRNQTQIAMPQFQEAIERIIAGPQKKSPIVTPEERRRSAYHESGHALVGYMTPGGDPVQKISIIPRAAGALGYTLQMPLEDRYLLSKDELLDRVRVLLGGRAAETVVLGSVSTGASDAPEKATSIVRDMLIRYGMSERAPNVSLIARSGSGYLGPEVAPWR